MASKCMIPYTTPEIIPNRVTGEINKGCSSAEADEKFARENLAIKIFTTPYYSTPTFCEGKSFMRVPI
jgi:hypothetical protein